MCVSLVMCAAPRHDVSPACYLRQSPSPHPGERVRPAVSASVLHLKVGWSLQSYNVNSLTRTRIRYYLDLPFTTSKSPGRRPGDTFTNFKHIYRGHLWATTRSPRPSLLRLSARRTRSLQVSSLVSQEDCLGPTRASPTWTG